VALGTDIKKLSGPENLNPKMAFPIIMGCKVTGEAQARAMEDDDVLYALKLWEQEESETGDWIAPAAQPAVKRGGGGRDCGAGAKSVLFSFPRRKSKALEEGGEEEEEGDVVQVSLPFEGEDNIVRLTLPFALLFILLLLLHITNSDCAQPFFADTTLARNVLPDRGRKGVEGLAAGKLPHRRLSCLSHGHAGRCCVPQG